MVLKKRIHMYKYERTWAIFRKIHRTNHLNCTSRAYNMIIKLDWNRHPRVNIGWRNGLTPGFTWTNAEWYYKVYIGRATLLVIRNGSKNK